MGVLMPARNVLPALAFKPCFASMSSSASGCSPSQHLVQSHHSHTVRCFSLLRVSDVPTLASHSQSALDLGNLSANESHMSTDDHGQARQAAWLLVALPQVSGISSCVCGKFRMLLRHALSFCCMITRHCWLCLQQCCIQAWPGSKHGAAARHAETGPESGLGRRRTGTFGQGRITRPRSLFRSNFPTCWIWSSVVYCSCTSNPKITPRDGQTATSTQAQLADCHAFGAS